MAFPQVAATSSGHVLTDGTSHVVTMPSGTGGRCIIFFHKDGTGVPTNDGSGWTNVSAAVQLASRTYFHVLYKDGHDGTSVTFTTTSEMVSWVVLRITGADTASAPEFGIVAVDNTANPPSLTASWGSADNLWIAGLIGDPGWSYTTAAPTNYTGAIQLGTISSSNDSVSLSVAFRELTTATEDPGSWSMGATNSLTGFTVVVRPGAAAAAEIPQLVMAPPIPA